MARIPPPGTTSRAIPARPAAPDSPLGVYQALIAAGASTTQAIGIMANVINESRFNPEAVGDQGTSFGIVQEHGLQYSGLVTGNKAADLLAQVKMIALNGGFRAASGATPAEAAGNFAANYERCVGCQQGGDQFNQRVGNAATVAGWVSSGKWPTSAGSGGGSSSASPSGPDCAAQWPRIGPIGGGCMIRKATLRHAAGIGLMAAGGIVALPGVLILVAFGLKSTGGLGRAADAAAVVPGGQGVAAGLQAAQQRAGRSGGQALTRRRLVRRENAAEDRELQERGASDIRQSGRRSLGPPTRPGRRISSRRAEEADQDRPPF